MSQHEDVFGEQNKRVIKSDTKIYNQMTKLYNAIGKEKNPEVQALAKGKYLEAYNFFRVGLGIDEAKKMPMKDVEDILVFYKKPPTYNPQGVVECNIEQHNSMSDSLRGKATDPTSVVTGGIDFKPYKQTLTNYPRQVLEFASEGKTVHPTQKPVALLEYLIRTYTKEGETVLDFTMGSGSTGVAAMNTGRKFIGIEMDDGYYDVAVKRIEESVK